MSVDIKLNLIKPSKDLVNCSLGYHIFSPVKEDRSSIPMLRLLTLMNNDFNSLLNNQNYYDSTIKKLILNKKLTSCEKNLVKLTNKVIKAKIDYTIDKKFSDIYFNKYKIEVLPKLTKILESLFLDLSIELYVYFTDDPFKGGSGGSVTDIGFYLSLSKVFLESNNHQYSIIFRIFTHELLHSVNDNSKEYLSIKQKLNKKDIHLFSEILTSTIENICMYELGYSDCKYLNYRYNLDPACCRVEDRLREVYDSWEKVRGKNKDKFIVYLEKNIDKVFLID